MRKLLIKMEMKFGKYAVPNLTMYLMVCYAAGLVLQAINPGFVNFMYLDVYRIIHKFEIWRLISWLFVPSSSGIFAVIMMLFYYSIGSLLERCWGTFRYNLYLLNGIFLTLIGAFLIYGFYSLFTDVNMPEFSMICSVSYSIYYICTSLLLAYAVTFPDNRVLLMFMIPLRVIYLGLIYLVELIYEFVAVPMPGSKVAIAATLINFAILFFSTGGYFRISFNNIKRKKQFKDSYDKGRAYYQSGFGRKIEPKITPEGRVSIHKCAVCGRTELDNDELEFRFCSRCNGNYEYCSEHLYTHVHVE
ncbi:MAG: rhomboid family intramembrane serine protease [Lachnospiraceae bacterium]|nr:rhomboid family intramembrane serine protease [Lachnospiraceae bacterium]